MNKIDEIKDMKAEISGLGGSYEEHCRKMLVAGLHWFEDHPKADPKFMAFKNVYGIIRADNEDAKTLSNIVVEASGGDCTGPMHQAVIETIFLIRKHGLQKYLQTMNSKNEIPNAIEGER